MRTSYGVPLVADSASSHHLGLPLILWHGVYLLVCPFLCFTSSSFHSELIFFFPFCKYLVVYPLCGYDINKSPSPLKEILLHCRCTKKPPACIHTTAYLLGHKGIPGVTFSEMNEHTHEERMPLRYCLDTENLSHSPSLIIVQLHFRDNKLPGSTPDEI